MSNVFRGRFTAQVEGPFVVFNIGMRINRLLAVRRPPENRSARVVQADQYKCVYGNKPKNPNPSIERTSSCLRLPSLPHVVTKLL